MSGSVFSPARGQTSGPPRLEPSVKSGLLPVPTSGPPGLLLTWTTVPSSGFTVLRVQVGSFTVVLLHRPNPQKDHNRNLPGPHSSPHNRIDPRVTLPFLPYGWPLLRLISTVGWFTDGPATSSRGESRRSHPPPQATGSSETDSPDTTPLCPTDFRDSQGGHGRVTRWRQGGRRDNEQFCSVVSYPSPMWDGQGVSLENRRGSEEVG